MSCRYEHQCSNTDKCIRCSNEMMFKPKKGFRAQMIKTPNASSAKAQDDDSWKDLEQKVADAISAVPDIKQATRSICSGAMWFQKGDVVDEILHPEAKERIGDISKDGAKKSFSVKKEWLVKAKEESLSVDKTMCLPFRFKEDEEIYMVFLLEDIAELVTHMKALITENKKLAAKIAVLEQDKKD